MVREGMDAPSRRKGLRERTFRYDPNNEKDKAILKKINALLFSEQQRCENCENFDYKGGIGGYMGCDCQIYGNLEWLDSPHYGMDGSACEDYKRNDDAIEKYIRRMS